jgi:hypothetical protein
MMEEKSGEDGNSKDIEPQSARLMVSGEQRRRLLRAAAGSGVLVTAGVPVAAQAATRPHCKLNGSPQKFHATASAVGSVIGSMTGSLTPNYGNPCSHYQTSGNWPATCTNGKGRNLSYNSCVDVNGTGKLRFFVAFELPRPSSGSNAYRYCSDIIANYPTSDEAVWLTAVFNANKLGTAFTYTPSDVLDLYNSKNPQAGGVVQSGLNAKALTLFRNYLSQGVPT